MNVTVELKGGTNTELADLSKWLGEEDALRGRVRVVPKPITNTELGSLSDTLAVAVGTGGMGTVLASCLKTWLRTRRTNVTITVEVNGRRVSMNIRTVERIAPMLDQILEASNDH